MVHRLSVFAVAAVVLVTSTPAGGSITPEAMMAALVRPRTPTKRERAPTFLSELTKPGSLHMPLEAPPRGPMQQQQEVTGHAAPMQVGVEISDWPCGTINILPRAYGGWLAPVNSTLAAVDADGWPTEDAFIELDVVMPSQLDPEHHTATLYGTYYFDFVGQGTVILAPNLNFTLLNATYDPAAGVTVGYLELPPGSALGILVIGVVGTRRNTTAPVGSGFTRLRILQPGFSPADLAAGAVFTPAFLGALLPFAHGRSMTWTYNNYVILYNETNHGRVGWSDRRRFDAALWGDGVGGNSRSFGVPWEAVVLLAQATRTVGVWLVVPVQASGAADDADPDAYVAGLATLLRDGNAFTAGAGVPDTLPVYVEHGNEVWLNGSASFLWNVAAAADEVASGRQPWAQDGCVDPFMWELRRHVSRLYNVSLAFKAVFAGAASGFNGSAAEPGNSSTWRVRPVLGWFQELAPALDAVLTWHAATYSVPASAWLYGVAVNTYRVSGLFPNATAATWFAADQAQSDAARPLRDAVRTICVAHGGLRLMAYEGSMVGIPLYRDAATYGMVIEASRDAGVAEPITYDAVTNWAAAGGAEYNFFALSSTYDVWQWGLVEDVRVTATPKYQAAVALLAGGAAVPAAAVVAAGPDAAGGEAGA